MNPVDPAGIDTPIGYVDLERVRANAQRVADYTAQHGIAWRPHIKTHKSLEVARIQLEAGARGLTVATLREAIIDALSAAYGVYDRARDQHWPNPFTALTTWSHPRDVKTPCPNCDTKMTAIRVRARGTYFCSKCQI